MLRWSCRTKTSQERLKVGDKAITACGISPDGETILAGTIDGLLGQWDSEKLERRSFFLAHTRPISQIVFSPNEELIATSAWDRNVILWHRDGSQKPRILAGHQDMVSGCQFLPEGNTLLSWSYDGTIRLWELARASEVGAWGGHEDRITSGAVSPDGKWFATASRDGVVLLWDARNLQEAGRYVDHRAEICGCFFSTDARLLITVSALGEVVTHAIPEFQTHSGQESGVAVRSASLSHDGERLVLGGEDGKLSFFKVEAATQRSSCATAVLSHEPRRKKGLLGSLFRVEELQPVLRCVCPVCRTSFEVGSQPGAQAKCPGCCRDLRLNPFTRPAV